MFTIRSLVKAIGIGNLQHVLDIMGVFHVYFQESS